jgi:type IV/VI secretion system ImpK/VasF family protein
MMRHELWRAVLAAFVDIDRLVASSAGDLPDRAPISSAPARTGFPGLETAWRDLQLPERPPGPAPIARPLAIEPPDERDRQRLRGLHEAVRARLEPLWRQLAGEDGSDRNRRALVIYLDERIMGLLPEYLALSWPLLQTELTGATTGGTDFFRLVDHALQDPRCPPLVLEVYYFCLNHGFVGMHAKDTVQLDHHKRSLAARMSLPDVSPPARTRASQEDLPARWPAWSYYMIALAVVVVVTASLTILSNLADYTGGGSG